MPHGPSNPIPLPRRLTLKFAAAAILLSILGLTLNTSWPQRDKKPLRAGFNEFNPFLSATAAGKPAGLAVDVLNEAAKRSGQTLEWVRVNDAESGLASGKIDLFPLLTVTPGRLKKFYFSDYWWQNSLELVSPRQRPINNSGDAAGKKIGLRLKGLVGTLAKSLFPAAAITIKPTIEELVRSLCSGEVDALFVDSRSVERYLIDRPLPCRDLKLNITLVHGATMPLGTASTLSVQNRVDTLFSHLDEIVADGTLANLAATYSIALPDSNLHLAQLIQNRHRFFLLSIASVGLCCVLVLFVFIGVRMRVAQRVAEDARRSLEEIQQRFDAFMNNSPAIAYMKDGAGRMVYVNDAYCSTFGIAPEDRLGKTCFDVLPHFIAEQLRVNDQKVIESNCGRQFTECTPDQNGQQRNWLSFKFPFHGQSGEVFLGGVSIDITEMTRAQEALCESESRYRQIVEFAGDIIVRCDANGRVTYINEMGARVLNVPFARLKGRRALNFIPREFRKVAIRNLQRALAEGISDFYLEVPVVTGDGSRLWLGQNIRLMRANGSISGFQAISRDITVRKKMEAELRTSEERFRLLYENGPVAYHEIDREGVIRRVNHAECTMLGIPADELVGRQVIDLIAPEDKERARAAVRSKINGELALQPFIRTILRRDGRRVRVEVHENLLRDDTGKVIGIHSVLLDVTQRHLSEVLDHDRTELSEMIAQQRPLDHILSGIAGMIAHQDESLRCITLRMENRRANKRHLEAVDSAGIQDQDLCDAIVELGDDALSVWSSNEFRVTHQSLGGLAAKPLLSGLTAAAIKLGIESCWSIPIISSSNDPLGMLLVFSKRASEATEPEKQLMEAASRLAAIAIEHRAMTDLLAFQAGHDSLTSLDNRASFETRLFDAISCASAKGEQLAVLYVDLDRFKQVNDTFGHSSGDQLLRQVAARMRRCIRKSDTLARIGGDEFCVLLPGLRDTSEADRVAQAIICAVRSAFMLDGSQVMVTASIGISIYPQDGLDAPTLQRNSDIAMYEVKKAGKNNFHSYSAERGAPAQIAEAELVA